MRILIISNLYPPIVEGGYERECFGVVEHLRRDHEVVVITSSRNRGAVEDDPAVKRVLPLLSQDWRGSLRAPVASLSAGRAVHTATREFQPEFVYVWNGENIPVAAILAAAQSGAPLAFRICEYWFRHMGGRHDQFVRHLLPGDRGSRAIWAQLMRTVNRHPALRLDPFASFPASICWNSKFVREATPVPDCVSATHEDLIYPSLPQTNRFAEVKRAPSAEPTIAFIGRLANEKGVEIAIRALASVRSRHSINARLFLAGPIESDMKTILGRLIAQLGISDHVVFNGILDTEDLASLLASVHAVVVPPTWDEPAGLVPVEAALARVPVVASRSGGIPEILHEDEHILLFDIGDAERCADLLARTMTNRAETEARVLRARARAEKLSFGPYIDATDRFIQAAVLASRTT
jgi:glycosyltransferase involved in cell wall biosynthesis